MKKEESEKKYERVDNMVEIDADELAALKARAAGTVQQGSIVKPISQTGVRINPDPKTIIAQLGLHPEQEPSIGVWGFFKDKKPVTYLDPKTGKATKTEKLLEVTAINVPSIESPMGSAIEPLETEVSVMANLIDGSWPTSGVNTMGIRQWDNLIKGGLKKVD